MCSPQSRRPGTGGDGEDHDEQVAADDGHADGGRKVRVAGHMVLGERDGVTARIRVPPPSVHQMVLTLEAA